MFAAGDIVPAFQALDAVQQGTVEICHTATYYYVGKDFTMGFGTALPFGLTTRQQNAWMYHGGGIDTLNDFFKDYGVIAFPAGNTGAQMGGWFRNPVNKLGDFKGLKMRIPGLGGQVMARLGAVPQALPGGDIYPALERGAIDATEWVGPYDDEKLGFYKIAKHYYYPGWWEPCSMYHVMVNLQKWAELPKAYQEAIISAAREANLEMVARIRRQEPPCPAAAEGGRRADPQILRRDHGGRLQGRHRALRGRGGEEPEVQSHLRRLDEVPRRGGAMVRAGRIGDGSVLRGQAEGLSVAPDTRRMRLLLGFADAVDWLSEWIGQWLKWLVLASSLISAGNALVRYTFHPAPTRGSKSSGTCSAPCSCWRRAMRSSMRSTSASTCSSADSPEPAGLGRRVGRHPVPDADRDPDRLDVDPDGGELLSASARCRPMPAACCAGRSRS